MSAIQTLTRIANERSTKTVTAGEIAKAFRLNAKVARNKLRRAQGSKGNRKHYNFKPAQIAKVAKIMGAKV